MKLVNTVLLLCVAALLVTPAFAQKGDEKLGKAVYTKSCVTCHGAAGEGKPAIARLMKVELRDLGSKEVQAQSDAVLRKAVMEGTGKMKLVKDVKEADLPNLLAYMRTLAHK